MMLIFGGILEGLESGVLSLESTLAKVIRRPGLRHCSFCFRLTTLDFQLQTLFVPVDRLPQSIFQRRLCAKAKSLVGARGVELPARLSIRLACLPSDLAFEASQMSDDLNQILDDQLAAISQIHWIAFVITGRCAHNSFRAIFDIEKLARGTT